MSTDRNIDKQIKRNRYDDIVDFSGSILKYKRDNLNYSSETLQNNLKILFIEDDMSVRSKVSMYVRAGSNQNPEEYPGLAHFLEHMLFMGSKKYPDADHYHKIVAKNNGSTNAYTASDHTLYFFDSFSNTVLDIVDIFCNFFIDPLFDPKYVDKEITAVNYEYQKNISSDLVRTEILGLNFSSDDVNTRFTVGSNETLRKDGILDALKKFYDKYYSTDNMLLVIVHNKIDDMFRNKIRNIFGKIRKKSDNSDNSDKIKSYPLKLQKKELETVISERISPGTVMIIKFFSKGSNYRDKELQKSEKVIDYILDRRGPGSLHYILDKTSLIQNYRVYTEYFTADTSINICLTLTEFGYSNSCHILYIVICYINQIFKNKDIFDTFYKELTEIIKLNINTMTNNSGNNVSETVIQLFNSLDVDLRYFPVIEAVDNLELMRNHFYETIRSTLDFPNIFHNTKIIISRHLLPNTDLSTEAKKICNIDNSKNKLEEMNIKIDEYYKTRYFETSFILDKKLFNKYLELDYGYPQENTYIETDPKIVSPKSFKKNKQDPQNIGYDKKDYMRLKSDNYHFLMRHNICGSYKTISNINILLSANKSRDEATRNYLILYFYFKLINTIHLPEKYMRNEAGNYVDMAASPHGFYITFDCHESFAVKILEEYIKWIFDDKLEINLRDYKKIFDSTKERYNNMKFTEPFTRLGDFIEDIMNPDYPITLDKILLSLDSFHPDVMRLSDKNNKNGISFSNLQEKAISILSKGEIRSIITGSISIENANKIVKLLDSKIKHSDEFKIKSLNLPAIKQSQSKSQSKSQREEFYIKKNDNKQDPNKGVSYCIYIGNCIWSEYDPVKNPKPFRNLISYRIMTDIINQSFFNLIRTEKQLGYFVDYGIQENKDFGTTQMFMNFSIQTQIDDVIDHIRSFVDTDIMKILKKVTDSQLESIKENIITNISEKYRDVEEYAYESSKILFDLTHDEIDKIGKTYFLNKLDNNRYITELKQITMKKIVKLFEKAIKEGPRYVFMIIPYNTS